MLYGWWINDGETLEWSGRLGQPRDAACPNGVPPGRVGFRVSRDLISMYLAYRAPDELLLWCVFLIALITTGTKFECEQILGVGRLKSQLGSTFSDITPYPCVDLIKHQQLPWAFISLPPSRERMLGSPSNGLAWKPIHWPSNWQPDAVCLSTVSYTIM
jgi:hypothetical protein